MFLDICSECLIRVPEWRRYEDRLPLELRERLLCTEGRQKCNGCDEVLIGRPSLYGRVTATFPPDAELLVWLSVQYCSSVCFRRHARMSGAPWGNNCKKPKDEDGAEEQRVHHDESDYFVDNQKMKRQKVT